MSVECREECCIVESESLCEMLENYLQKHKFCPDCKGTLMRAYRCLVGETDVKKERGYNAKLYEGLRYCSKEGHLHVKGCVNFLDKLVERAEADLAGNTRERHAKTLEIGQLEVLTCLGLFMHGRLHRMHTQLKSLQNTYQLFYCCATIALFNNFQSRVDNTDAMTDSFEQLCAELQTSAANPQLKVKNVTKKRNKKATGKADGKKSFGRHSPISESSTGEHPSSCSPSPPNSGRHRSPVPIDENHNIKQKSQRTDEGKNKVDTKTLMEDDGGYISREGSPAGMNSSASSNGSNTPPQHKPGCGSCIERSARCSPAVPIVHGLRSQPPLSELIAQPSSPTVVQISQEQINWFEANHSEVNEQREALRKRISEQFKAMQWRLSAK